MRFRVLATGLSIVRNGVAGGFIRASAVCDAMHPKPGLPKAGSPARSE